MFGANELRKQDLGNGQTLEIKEVFHTIQGEGPYTGIPAIFVRLAGCNLRCYFCDTDFDKGDIIPLDVLIEDIVKLGPAQLVVITGGEPMRQNLVPLIRKLDNLMYYVQIETAGTLWVPGLQNFKLEACTIVVSPKTGKLNLHVAKYAHYYKYLIKEGEICDTDGLPNKSTQQRNKELYVARPPKHVPKSSIYVHPLDEYNDERNAKNVKAATDTALKWGYRLGLQVHKIVGLR